MAVLQLLFMLLAHETWAQSSFIEGYISSCPKTGTSSWNKRSVGANIKYWIKSINVLSSGSVENSPIRFDESGFLRSISKLDPKTGRPAGTTWRVIGENEQQFLDGILVGPIDPFGEITGDNVVFLFPDMETVLVGKWEKSVMKEARAGRIVAERCQNGMKVFKYKMSKKNRGVYKYQRPTRNQPGDQPTLIDPYEQRTIYVGDGLKDDGIFAKRDIKKGELVAYYAGLIMSMADLPQRQENMTKQDIEDLERNFIAVDSDTVADLPKDYWELSQYRATLSHKLNHSFTRSKTRFGSVTHPRFGLISCVIATNDIGKDEEIFVDYGYTNDADIVPDWYAKLFKEETGKQFKGGSNNQQCGQ